LVYVNFCHDYRTDASKAAQNGGLGVLTSFFAT
jgi:hypothetical protein